MNMRWRIAWCCVLWMLAGCGPSGNRYGRWISAQFTQACQRDAACYERRSYVRHEDVYDGFNTVGHYDALWYATPVRLHHIDRLACRGGWSSEEYEARMMQEQEDDRARVVFYLLLTHDSFEGLRPHLATPAGKGDIGIWSAVLCVDGTAYSLQQARQVILPTELLDCFGERFDFHYRYVYRVEFARVDKGHDILAGASNITLSLRSANYAVNFCWDGILAEEGCAPLIEPDGSCENSCFLDKTIARSPMTVEEVRP